jgi:hypothetical protein
MQDNIFDAAKAQYFYTRFKFPAARKANVLPLHVQINAAAVKAV